METVLMLQDQLSACVCVCLSVCCSPAFLCNYGTYRLQIFSVHRHQLVLREERKKLTVDLLNGRYNC